ncbi:MAG: TPM domain-containing protein [Oscillospiraceae bacterium]|nr:TPM domain-containing protein [Oscillospiraceae bacterium]
MNEAEIRNKFLAGNKLKIKTAWIAVMALVVITAVFSFDYFKEPDNGYKENVYNDDGILSDTAIEKIEGGNRVLYDAGISGEIVVVAEKNSGGNRNLPKRAEELFKKYKVSENGVLIIMSVPTGKSSGIKAAISGFLDDLLGRRYRYSYFPGRNVDYALAGKVENDFEPAFNERYENGDYNGAVLSMFGSIFDYFAAENGLELPEPDAAVYAAGELNKTESSFSPVSVIGMVILLIFIISIFGRKSGKKEPYSAPHRVYKSPGWFGY